MTTFADAVQIVQQDTELLEALRRVDTQAVRRALEKAKKHALTVASWKSPAGSPGFQMFVQWGNAALTELNEAGVITQIARLFKSSLKDFDFTDAEFIKAETDAIAQWECPQEELLEYLGQLVQGRNQRMRSSIFLSMDSAGIPAATPAEPTPTEGGGGGGGAAGGVITGIDGGKIIEGIEDGDAVDITTGVLSIGLVAGILFF